MRILTFHELHSISNQEILETKQRVKNFLENRPDIVFAGFYGGIITKDFDRFSDVDVFVIYQDFDFINELQSAYIDGYFGEVEIEWQLIPHTLLQKGIAKERNYLETTQINHEYITGYQDLFLKLESNIDPVLQFILRKLTKNLDDYVKGVQDTESLSRMLRSIHHIPRKLLGYTGTSNNDLRQKYYNLIENNLDFRENYLKLIDAWFMYKTSSIKIKTEKEYQELIKKIYWYQKYYIFWLHDNFLFYEQNKKVLQE